MPIFILFRSEISFLGWFGPNIQKSQFKIKFGFVYNLLINYLNLMIQKQQLTSVLQKSCLRGSRFQMFFKTGVLKNFAIFTKKHQCWSLFKKLQAWRPAKRPQHRCFYVNISKFLWTPFLQNTSIGCFCCFKKLVNFSVKHQYRRPNKFIFFINTAE